MARLALDDGDGDGELWYEVRGEGPPLVFVHGGWSNADVWRDQVERYADDYRVIVFDVRGHGRSGATDRRSYSVDLFTDDLERLLDHLDVERPVLCGLSLGAMVVQNYLDRHPDRAAGAILAGPVRSMPPVDLPLGVKPLVSPVPAIEASASTMGTEATFQSLLGGIQATTGERWLSLDESVRTEAIEAAGDIQSDEFGKIFDALYRFDPPDLSHVETPVFVIYGDAEALPVKRQGEELAAATDGDHTMVPNAGHLVNQDDSEAFHAEMSRFLADLDQVPARAD